MNDAYGHILSPKSTKYERDTFFFVTLHQASQLYLGVNQKLTPVTSAALHRWVDLMTGTFEKQEFFICPVTVHSAGIMSYFVRPSGPVIEPDSRERLAPGNYGWYFNRECTSRGFPTLSYVRQRHCPFEIAFRTAIPESERAIREPISPALEESVATRDGNRCRFTDSGDDVVAAWIIEPDISWETRDSGQMQDWDKTPFIDRANLLTMRKELVFHLLSNDFTVDVDDDYRILVFRPMDLQHPLPTHLPLHLHHDAAADHFLRLHCRYSLSVALRGGDIGHHYSDWAVLAAMDELGVDYIGSDNPDRTMVPLSDERWQTVLGKEILANLLETRAGMGLDALSWSGPESSASSPVPVSPAGDVSAWLPVPPWLELEKVPVEAEQSSEAPAANNG
ncbi:hypothetical protein B0H15DRAFT_562104 [Mycena belliarum]|uniref:Uncharacterized protein n=1 Tax=Mycena belliarum TaxID=1033014 RepID=A0AAD6XNS7_9AGAR|nr:hypothetical protein B0H15DRAFT_562104 [Mycena belliae]